MGGGDIIVWAFIRVNTVFACPTFIDRLNLPYLFRCKMGFYSELQIRRGNRDN